MVHKKWLVGSLALLLASFAAPAPAQAPLPAAAARPGRIGTPVPGSQSADAPVSRLAGDWRSSTFVTLLNNKPPVPQNAKDAGPAPSETRLERMLLLLEPSAAQRQALDAELSNQQTATSPEYHHWLTPAVFANAYANSVADVAAVASWLRSEGFEIAPLPAGRGWIEFSGSASQVEQAFHTQIHTFVTPGGSRVALAESIAVPAALRPVIHGLVSVDGIVSAAAVTHALPMGGSATELASLTQPAHAEALTPQIAAQLLHLDSLHSSGATGSGEAIAIPARSNIGSGRGGLSQPVWSAGESNPS